jgi:hypothetical protein
MSRPRPLRWMRHSKPLVDGLLQRTVSPAAGVSPGQLTQYCAPEHNSDAPDSLRIYCRSDSHYVSQEFVQSEGMVVTIWPRQNAAKTAIVLWAFLNNRF